MATSPSGNRKRRALDFIAGAPDAPHTPSPDSVRETPRDDKQRVTVSVALPAKLVEQIELIAYAEGKTRDAIIRTLLKRAVKG